MKLFLIKVAKSEECIRPLFANWVTLYVYMYRYVCIALELDSYGSIYISSNEEEEEGDISIPMSEYEMRRAKRIEENKRVFNEIFKVGFL